MKEFKLRNVVYKSQNLIIQHMNEGSRNIAIIVGSGHSVSVDDDGNVTFSDPCFHPPEKIKGYGNDCTIFTIYYPETCKGLDIAGKELARFINIKLQLYSKIILHGHSECGVCFLYLYQWLYKWAKLRTHVVSVSAPLKGTPFADFEEFSKNLNVIEKSVYSKFFSNNKVDRDVCPNSNFFEKLNIELLLESRYKNHFHFVVSKRGPSFNPIDWLLYLIDIRTKINGDGIVSLESQIPDVMYDTVFASHATSMRKSCKFVRDLI